MNEVGEVIRVNGHSLRVIWSLKDNQQNVVWSLGGAFATYPLPVDVQQDRLLELSRMRKERDPR